MAKVVYASNGGAIGDGVRVTRISNGGQTLEVMVDTKTERYSEVVLQADTPSPVPDPVPDPDPIPDPDPTPTTFDVVVNNASELSATLSTADGISIGCNPGNYGKLTFTRKPSGTVIVSSVDPYNMARFTGMKINNAANFVVDSVRSDYTYSSGHNDWDKHCEMLNSTNCGIQDCTIVGGYSSSGYGFSEGIFNRNGDGNWITGNLVTGFTRQIHNYKSSYTDISSNDLSLMRGDGITLTDSVGSTHIRDNHIHDFRCSPTDGYHRDAIEFWAESGQPNMDGLNISGNIIDIGDGAWSQSIFGRNTSGAQITDNIIKNYHTHGITANASNGITVTGNTVTKKRSTHPTCDQSEANGTSQPKINVPAVSGNISNNTVN